jgi:hypothetical protein
LGIIIEVRFSQSENTAFPRYVTELGIFIDVNSVPAKAACPIVFTELGMFIEERPLLLKA